MGRYNVFRIACLGKPIPIQQKVVTYMYMYIHVGAYSLESYM